MAIGTDESLEKLTLSIFIPQATDLSPQDLIDTAGDSWSLPKERDLLYFGMQRELQMMAHSSYSF